MRTHYPRLLCALLLSFPLFQAAVAHGQDANARARRQQADEAIRRKLDEPTSIDVIELEFGQLFRDIGKRHDLPIVLDPQGLEVAGVTVDQLVTVKLDNLTLRSALRIILRPLRLTAVARDEVLVITSLDCDESSAMIRVIPLTGTLEQEDPEQVLAALQLAWPENGERTDPRLANLRLAKPRAAIVGKKLILRGSPRHHELAEELLESLQSSP